MRYVTETLACFPYTTEDEVLFIIYQINRIISLEASPNLSYLKSFFKGAEQKMDQSIEQKCQIMAAMTLLLLLKNFLKEFYGLNNTKCQSFAPSSRPEKSLNKPSDSVLFDDNSSPFSLISSNQIQKEGWKAWKR
jgi:cohesin loading factor subunit SCC2